MAIYATQRSATRNQSTVDFQRENVFLFGNRYSEAVLLNNLGESMNAKDGFLVVRNSGTFEKATVDFDTSLTAGQTMILAGLTYTSTGTTTAAELATAFANLQAGATTGAGTATGTYSGTLTGYSTGPNNGAGIVVFTASTVGNKTNLAATGTGTAPIITIVNGSDGVTNGVVPATALNLANVIGVLKVEDITLANTETANVNYAISGDIDSSLLILPVGVTLNTIVGSKSLKDILTGLGFVLSNVIENTKFDN